jgi:hypothetical protein
MTKTIPKGFQAFGDCFIFVCWNLLRAKNTPALDNRLSMTWLGLSSDHGNPIREVVNLFHDKNSLPVGTDDKISTPLFVPIAGEGRTRVILHGKSP